MSIIYISGPYSGDIDANIHAAREAAIDVWDKGNVALCPHLNTAHFEQDCGCDYEDYLEGDIELLDRCDAILMLPGWDKSKGARIEFEHAEREGMPVYYYPDIPDRCSTEILRPVQVHAFIRTVMRLYRIHLQKNADYSPANILGAGEIGVVTRIWDKVSRLMNLTGFKMEISASHFEKPDKPKNESIDDTFMDLAVYAIIGILHRAKAWGK